MGDRESEHDILNIVTFTAGKWRAGFEARTVRASRPEPTGAACANVETLLGLEPPTEIVTRQPLLLKQADGNREILVGSPVDLVSLPANAIHSLPSLLAARCKLNGLSALALEHDAKNVILLFSAEKL
ncbi:MAG: hypothetical protein U1C96_09230 [Gallionella sp.]|nr:hypothetical protein [Gallionella sp.]